MGKPTETVTFRLSKSDLRWLDGQAKALSAELGIPISRNDILRNVLGLQQRLGAAGRRRNLQRARHQRMGPGRDPLTQQRA